jgi:ATP-binding cassette subfamily B protein
MDDVVRVAKAAQLHDHIASLPDGYDTWVGERGVTLSGGQRQRLSIARTILLDPPVLVLDDSTSSVDVETERQIHQAMKEVMKGRTTFVIAHRLSTVREADIIMVLDNGRVAEQGSHDELMAKAGMYRDIYELQLKPQEDVLMDATLASSNGDGANVSAAPAVVRDGGTG